LKPAARPAGLARRLRGGGAGGAAARERRAPDVGLAVVAAGTYTRTTGKLSERRVRTIPAPQLTVIGIDLIRRCYKRVKNALL